MSDDYDGFDPGEKESNFGSDEDAYLKSLGEQPPIPFDNAAPDYDNSMTSEEESNEIPFEFDETIYPEAEEKEPEPEAQLKDNNILTMGTLDDERLAEIKGMLHKYEMHGYTDEELLLEADKADILNLINKIDDENEERESQPLGLAELKGVLRRKERTRRGVEKIIEEGGDRGNPWTDNAVNLGVEFYTSRPPERPEVIEGFMPQGQVCILGAKGGVGKSMLCIQLCLALAGGDGIGDFFGLNTKNEGKVMLLSGEDSKDIIQNRIQNILETYDKTSDTRGKIDVKKAAPNLLIKDLSSQSFNLTHTTEQSKSNAVVNDAAVSTIIETVNKAGDVSLIVIDTYSQFNGGAENSNDDASNFITACSIIAEETGASVLVLAHMRKGGGNSADDVAGGGRLIDNARWAATLSPYLDEKDYDSLEMDEQEALKHIVFKVVKDNHKGMLGSSIYLRRNEVGTLVVNHKISTNKERGIVKRSANTDFKLVAEYNAILPMMLDIIGKIKGVSQTALSENYTDSGHFGMTVNRVRTHINRALSEGLIAEKKADHGNGSALFVVNQDIIG